MGTLNIQAVGFASLPAAVTKSYGTFSDADFAKIMAWVQITQGPLIVQMFGTTNPTNSQLFQAWVQSWINQSIISQQITATAAPSMPTAVVIGP